MPKLQIQDRREQEWDLNAGFTFCKVVAFFHRELMWSKMQVYEKYTTI